MRYHLRILGPVGTAFFCAAAVVLGVVGSAPSGAASIPAWLDEAITSWNERNPTLPIQFVAIRDSFVWYKVQDTPEIDHKEIREITYRLAQEHGYVKTEDEELVTTARPPSDSGRSTDKKCWRRSFVLNIENLGETTSVGGGDSGIRQRMLTTMVCEDGAQWAMGYRVSQ